MRLPIPGAISPPEPPALARVCEQWPAAAAKKESQTLQLKEGSQTLQPTKRFRTSPTIQPTKEEPQTSEPKKGESQTSEPKNEESQTQKPKNVEGAGASAFGRIATGHPALADAIQEVAAWFSQRLEALDPELARGPLNGAAW